MTFSFGFIYDNIQYGWYQRRLYRLPYTTDKRNFSLREIKSFRTGVVSCYNIKKKKFTIGRLKTMTVKVDWRVNNISNFNIP